MNPNNESQKRNHFDELAAYKVEIIRIRKAKKKEEYIKLVPILVTICNLRKKIGTNNGLRLRQLEERISYILKNKFQSIENDLEIDETIDNYLEELNTFINITKRSEQSLSYSHPILVIILSLIFILLAMYCIIDDYSFL